MSWLLQLIEDVEQTFAHALVDKRMHDFLELIFKDLSENATGKPMWDVWCQIGIQYIYQKAVQHLMVSIVDPPNMHAIDSDPQLFEGLLGYDSKYSAMTVGDLRPIGQMRGLDCATCLRSFMFNIPASIRDEVALLLDKALTHQAEKRHADELETIMSVETRETAGWCMRAMLGSCRA